MRARYRLKIQLFTFSFLCKFFWGCNFSAKLYKCDFQHSTNHWEDQWSTIFEPITKYSAKFNISKYIFLRGEEAQKFVLTSINETHFFFENIPITLEIYSSHLKGPKQLKFYAEWFHLAKLRPDIYIFLKIFASI